ncbi:MAG: hypothetical protein C5B54_11770 [Acidobacteria bacterium]|nr:MAG: hypothetical protein C5B54_11770 [Acidobacteriota bacterium]
MELAPITVKLDFDPKRVHGARLVIPMLAVDEHLTNITRIENLTPGTYDGTLTTYLTTGSETTQKVKIKIFPKSENIHHFNLSQVPHEVMIRPVDKKNKTILFSEIRIENFDMNFRPVRDEKGVACRLRPGDYTIRIVLPDLSVKTVPLKVSEDTLVYSLPIFEDETSTRKEPRIQMAIPISYQSKDGQWITTKSINISSSGVCLIKTPNKETEKKIHVRLVVPHTHSPVECEAEVKWEKDDADSSQMGLQMDLPQQMKTTLNKWLITGKA